MNKSIAFFPDFRTALLTEGFEYIPDHIEPGKLYRFAGAGKPKSNTAGWCRLFPDCLGGVYGDWAQGFTSVWQSDERKSLSPEEKKRFKREIEQAQREQREAQLKQWREASNRAREKWQAAQPESGLHRYLVDKQVNSYGLRSNGYQVLIPVLDIHGNWLSIQFIDPKGNKLFLKGGRLKGGMFVIGEIQPDKTVLICEGYSTGATLYEETGYPVVVAFNAGNLRPVAEAIRKKYPKTEIIICGDNDRKTEGNPGVKAATKAALAVNGKISIPEFSDDEEGTDWNDWYLNQREAVT